MRIMILLCIVTVLLVLSCSQGKTLINEKKNVKNTGLTNLEEQLQEHGLTIHDIQEVEQPFFAIPAKGLVIDNDQMIQVFEFRDSQEAEQVRKTISLDGMTIANTKPFWAQPPHFFANDQMVILYVGQDQNVLRVLREILGSQFAGK